MKGLLRRDFLAQTTRLPHPESSAYHTTYITYTMDPHTPTQCCSRCRKHQPIHVFWKGLLQPVLLQTCYTCRRKKTDTRRAPLGELDPNVQRRQPSSKTALPSSLSVANPPVATVPARNRTPPRVATSLPPAAIVPTTASAPRQRGRPRQNKQIEQAVFIHIDKPEYIRERGLPSQPEPEPEPEQEQQQQEQQQEQEESEFEEPPENNSDGFDDTSQQEQEQQQQQEQGDSEWGPLLEGDSDGEDASPPRQQARRNTRQTTVERRPRGRPRVERPPPNPIPIANISRLGEVEVLDLGEMKYECKHCGAYYWAAERSNRWCKKEEKYEFTECCNRGITVLDPLHDLPALLRRLFEGDGPLEKHFRNNIIYYNNALTFTSCRYALDERLERLHGGIKPVSIRGELYHLTGPLTAMSQALPSFAQTYFYDPNFVIDALLQDDRRQQVLKRDLLLRLRVMLYDVRNPFIEIYKTAKECLDNTPEDTRDIILNPQMKLFLQDGFNKRRTNVPTSTEIAIVIPDENNEPTCRDIVLANRSEGEDGSQFNRIDKTHPAYMPLHYVLFFPTGQPGWGWTLQKSNAEKSIRKRITHRAHARYWLYMRRNMFNPILAGTRLGQQYVVDNWAIIDQEQLDFIRNRQDNIRSDLYQGVVDALTDCDDLNDIGKRIILPSSYMGSDRFMQRLYQNSMAIVRHFGKPTLFITFTANPHWPELIAALDGALAQDRPEIVARVFNVKREDFMDALKTCFGVSHGNVWTLEFQVRGLPHVHILLFLDRETDFTDPDTIDQYIRAELLTPEEDPSGRVNEVVKSCMVHGPCGSQFPNAPCMVMDEQLGRKVCSKGFPKPFCDATTVTKDCFPTYRRRDKDSWTVKVQGREIEVDNRWIVPFSPYLVKKYEAHINVEVCAKFQVVKYVHKYIYKGQDRVTMDLSKENNEIHQYLISRYIGPQQAVWRILGYPIHGESPAVQPLSVHLPGEQAVFFDKNGDVASIRRKLEKTSSTLMAFFDYNRDHEDGRGLLYHDFPPHYVYKRADKESPAHWKPRQKDFAIGRMNACSPMAKERYYLRLLLTAVRGPTSYEHLRTVDGDTKPTFKEACRDLGLLHNDDEWNSCFDDAKGYSSGTALRRLFIQGLAIGEITDPDTMWTRFREHFCDDLLPRVRRFGPQYQPAEDFIFDYGLYLIKLGLDDFGMTPRKVLLQSHEMPWDEVEGDAIVNSELRYDHINEQADFDTAILSLNADQRRAFETITAAIERDPELAQFFLHGPAGTGKSFLYKTLCHYYRARGEIVLCVASSGIAALVLPGGTTAHSRFKIKLNCDEDSYCDVTKQHSLCRLMQRTRLIIWDEVPMQHRYNVESVHRTLCDFMDNDKPFGGIPVVLGGDFAQTVPVVKKGSRAQQCSASLRRSFLWPSLQILHLRQNMRVRVDDDNNKAFAEWLAKMSYEPNMRGKIELPYQIHDRYYDRNAEGKIDDANGLHKLCDRIYPPLFLAEAHRHPEIFRDRAILTLRNDTAAQINAHIQKSIVDEEKVFYAINTSDINDEGDHHLSEDFLQSVDDPSIPAHELRLKVGSPIMLMRNLYPKEGLCNGTRLIVTHLGRTCIEAKILGGNMNDEKRLIPRIKLSTDKYALEIHRTQFPIRLCFAITVNKSQGQTLKTVGVDLRTHCFGHGQLYVALSRVTDVNRLSVLLKSEQDDLTDNVVWPEVLLGYLQEQGIG